MYIDPFAYEPLVAVGLPPPVLPGGINGSTSLHSSSVRSLGYRNSLRSYRARFLLVHIGDPSSNQATTLESQMIHMIQELSGRTLRALKVSNRTEAVIAVSELGWKLPTTAQLDLQSRIPAPALTSPLRHCHKACPGMA